MKLKEQLTTDEMLALKTFKDLLKEEIKQEIISEISGVLKQKDTKPIQIQGDALNIEKKTVSVAVEYEPTTEEEKKEFRLFINDIKKEVEQNNKTNNDVVVSLKDYINNVLNRVTDKPSSKMIEPEKRADFLKFLQERFKN